MKTLKLTSFTTRFKNGERVEIPNGAIVETEDDIAEELIEKGLAEEFDGESSSLVSDNEIAPFIVNLTPQEDELQDSDTRINLYSDKTFEEVEEAIKKGRQVYCNYKNIAWVGLNDYNESAGIISFIYFSTESAELGTTLRHFLLARKGKHKAQTYRTVWEQGTIRTQSVRNDAAL